MKCRAGLRNDDGWVRIKTLYRQGLEREIKPRSKKRRRREIGDGLVSEAASDALSMIEVSIQDLELPEYNEIIDLEMCIIIMARLCRGLCSFSSGYL